MKRRLREWCERLSAGVLCRFAAALCVRCRNRAHVHCGDVRVLPAREDVRRVQDQLSYRHSLSLLWPPFILPCPLHSSPFLFLFSSSSLSLLPSTPRKGSPRRPRAARTRRRSRQQRLQQWVHFKLAWCITDGSWLCGWLSREHGMYLSFIREWQVHL